VSNVADIPHAILVRALEPVEGVEIMRARRHSHPDHNLTNGPGKLCIAMGIDRELDGADLLGERVWIEEYERVSPRNIARGPRIGIDYAEQWIDKPIRGQHLCQQNRTQIAQIRQKIILCNLCNLCTVLHSGANFIGGAAIFVTVTGSTHDRIKPEIFRSPSCRCC
jgi:hypothetical protein